VSQPLDTIQWTHWLSLNIQQKGQSINYHWYINKPLKKVYPNGALHWKALLGRPFMAGYFGRPNFVSIVYIQYLLTIYDVKK